MIFLDTNVLPRVGSLKNVLMSAVLKVASHNKLKIHISEVVLEESVNIRKDLASEAIQKLQDAFNQASKVMDLDSIYIPDLQEIASSWRAELEAAFEVFPVKGTQAIEALKREAARKRPAREGKGARDSAIWLSMLDSASGYEAPIHFVSDNKEDFADTADAKRLHPDLLEDCKARGVEVVYHRNLDSLLDSLSKKVATAPDSESINGTLEILLEALFDIGLPHEISHQYHSGRGFLIDVRVSSIRKIKSYQVEDTVLSIVDLHLDVDTELADEVDPPKVALFAECRAWVQMNSQTGSIVTIDVEEITSLRTR
ncbi:PIN domain-containing protein [Streptomyces sp. NPDC046870]|uniref:PIN domain-containing protein n=1 Tax=Streptomyces sp. NPDC046870 TaxID=3155135 RepID=UPI0034533DD3